MDADLQHDETRLPAMLAALQERQLDVVIASRYCEGGGVGAWDNARSRMSAFATRLSRLVISEELSDPMSGFFLITRPAFERSVRRLSGEGYKILVDLFASTKVPYRFAEIPYTFATRVHGQSKLDSAVMWEFLMLLLDKRIGRLIPPRFVLFCAVGLFGVAVHLVALSIALNVFHTSFSVGQGAATLVAMTSNFAINNSLTYRDRRLRGWRWVKGLLSFYLLCGLGVIANVGVANVIFERPSAWWIAGVAGAAIGSIWNYAATAVFTWGRRR
jgi:dolichol-phosphate mannosyltransferase